MAYDYVGKLVRCEFGENIYEGVIMNHDKDDDSFHLKGYRLGFCKDLMRNVVEKVDPDIQSMDIFFNELKENGFMIGNAPEMYGDCYLDEDFTRYEPHEARRLILFGMGNIMNDILDASPLEVKTLYLGEKIHVYRQTYSTIILKEESVI